MQKTTPDDNFVYRFIGLNRVQRLGVSMQASDITGRRSVESPFSSLHNAEKTLAASKRFVWKITIKTVFRFVGGIVISVNIATVPH